MEFQGSRWPISTLRLRTGSTAVISEASGIKISTHCYINILILLFNSYMTIFQSPVVTQTANSVLVLFPAVIWIACVTIHGTATNSVRNSIQKRMLPVRDNEIKIKGIPSASVTSSSSCSESSWACCTSERFPFAASKDEFTLAATGGNDALLLSNVCQKNNKPQPRWKVNTATFVGQQRHRLIN